MRKKVLLFWFIIFQILSFHLSFTTLAEAPKNYLKGKFYSSVKDHFLVATEKMTDDRFKKTVIVMLNNDEEGAWGLIVNKPIGKVPLNLLINTSQKIKNEGPSSEISSEKFSHICEKKMIYNRQNK